MSADDAEGAASEVIRRIAEAVAAEDGPTVVALLADPEAPEASWRQAGLLCDAVASRRRTLVANLAGPGSGFDDFLGVEAGEGLEGVRTGRIKLGEAPLQLEGRRFLYLPAGRQDPASGDQPPLPLEDAAVVGAVEKLAVKIRQADGALLLYLTPEALPDRHAADLMDGAVRLAGAVAVGGLRTLGRLDAGGGGPDESVEEFLGLPTGPEEETAGPTPTEEAPSPPAEEAEPPARDVESEGGAASGGVESEGGAASGGVESEAGRSPGGPGPPSSAGESGWYREKAPSGDASDAARAHSAGPGREAGLASRVVLAIGDPDADAGGSSWRRHRRTAGAPWGKILTGVVLVAAAAAGWWYLAERATPEATEVRATAGQRSAEGAASGAAGNAAVGTPEDEAATGAVGDEAAGALSAVESAPERPYSVLVASYGSWAAARERLDRWGSEDGAPVVFAAPTPVGDRVYWRVYAGALADRQGGLALNRGLVDRGWKDGATDWEVRPVSLAFRLSAETSRQAAGERISELRNRDVPAYALPAAAGGDTAWGIWAGAYESREDASNLGRSLRRAGVDAELVARRGTTGGS